jgi:positive regulator of sigma E activity
MSTTVGADGSMGVVCDETSSLDDRGRHKRKTAMGVPGKEHAPVSAARREWLVESWVVRAARRHWGRWADERELAHAIHGTIVGAAVMAAASAHGTFASVVASVFGVLAIYWLAELYAEVLASGVRGAQPTSARVAAACRRGWPMVEAAYVPLVVLVVVHVLADLASAVLAALVVSTLLLTALGFLASRRSGATRLVALGWAAGSGAFGLVIIGFKLFLH